MLKSYASIVRKRKWQHLSFIDIKDIYDSGFMISPPDMRDKEGRHVVLFAPRQWNAYRPFSRANRYLSSDDVQVLLFFVFDWMSSVFKDAATRGIVCVTDWTDFDISREPAYVRMVRFGLKLMAQDMPVNIAQIYHVNHSAGFKDKWDRCVQPLLDSSDSKTLLWLDSTDDLRQYFDEDNILESMGGRYCLDMEFVESMMMHSKDLEM